MTKPKRHGTQRSSFLQPRCRNLLGVSVHVIGIDPAGLVAGMTRKVIIPVACRSMLGTVVQLDSLDSILDLFRTRFFWTSQTLCSLSLSLSLALHFPPTFVRPSFFGLDLGSQTSSGPSFHHRSYGCKGFGCKVQGFLESNVEDCHLLLTKGWWLNQES